MFSRLPYSACAEGLPFQLPSSAPIRLVPTRFRLGGNRRPGAVLGPDWRELFRNLLHGRGDRQHKEIMLIEAGHLRFGTNATRAYVILRIDISGALQVMKSDPCASLYFDYGEGD